MAICQRLKSRQGVRQQNSILLVAVFLNQEFCGSFQGVYFCSVVGAQVTSWDGEGGGCSIWAMDVGSTASILNSILCRAICEDVSPGALRIVTPYHLQYECFLQFWSLCSLCCKAWNFSSYFWKALPRCPDARFEFLTFSWICLQKICVFFLQVLQLVIEALSFQAVFGSMLKFMVEWMTGQSLQLLPQNGSFVLTSALQRLKVCSLFHLLDWCASHST